MNAPTNSPAKYSGTSPHAMSPAIGEPERHRRVQMRPAELADRERAGHDRHAPAERDHDPAASSAPWTGSSSTHATTPLPSKIRSAVPITSAPKMLKSLSSPLRRVALHPTVRHTSPRRPAMSNAFRFGKPNPVRLRFDSYAGTHPVDRTRRGDPAAPVRTQPPPRRGPARGRAGAAEGDRARHPADARRGGLRRAGRRDGQVPARRGAAAHGQLLPGRQRAARAGAQLVRRARRAQRGERPDRHAARGPRARRPPRLPARRQPPGARGRRAAAGARDRAWARCCWPRTATSRPS